MPTTGPGNYEEALELWRSKLRAAQAQHQTAVKKYRQASRDYKAGVFRSPDGSLVLRQALLDENAALQEYMRVLIIFNDFLIRGRPLRKLAIQSSREAGAAIALQRGPRAIVVGKISDNAQKFEKKPT